MDFILMISANVILVTIAIGFLSHYLKSTSTHRRSAARLPPGPYPLPIIGNILQVGQNPHHSLSKLSKTYGPLMHLKFGSVDTIVVSSLEIAKEILQKHDQAFPRRAVLSAARAHDHHESSVGWLPIGPQWRTLRKIMREQMFSTRRLDASQGLRQEKIQKLLDYVGHCCMDGRAVNIGEAAFVTLLNLISNTMFSMDFGDYGNGSCQELMEVVRGTGRVLGSGNISDYFPILEWFDPQGIRKEAEIYVGKLLSIFDGIIERRNLEHEQQDSPKKKDLLEALLEICQENPSELSCNDIRHLLLDLFVAGIDTTSITVEWIMTELLRNPDVIAKAKNELKAVIGKSKQVEESDISSLPYLQAVVNENFRYHPTGAFMGRYKDDGELEINCFVMPKKALILINLWAINKDPSVWSNPELFVPERFLNKNVDIEGHNSNLVPFGVGRRICPGVPLASRMVHLMVASLIHNFDWKLELEMEPQEVDVSEKFGLSLQKAVPLKAVPTKS